MREILTYLKDALLCLMVCTTISNAKSKSYVSLIIIVVLVLMGIDLI